MKLTGAVVPIVTPVDATGSPDESAIAKVASTVVEAGCRHVMVCGSTGRGPWFSREQRTHACRTVREAIPDSILLAGCMGAGLDEITANIDTMAGAGADVAVVTAPYYFKYAPGEVEQIFTTIADRSALPVLLYDIPEFADTGLSAAGISRLLAHRNIVGLKDSSASVGRFTSLLETLDGEEVILLQGKEPLLTESLALGASGFVVSFVHCDPRAFATLAEAVKNGARATADRIQTAVTSVYHRYVDAVSRNASPQTSSLFFFLEHALRLGGLDVRLTLDHEGIAPPWTIELAKYAISTLKAARDAVGGGDG